jgi:Plasmid pRiA4b ORF-3-like protein
MSVYAIKITLLDTKPPIWRRFLIESDVTLDQLHRVLQILMGWSNSHLHQFMMHKRKQAGKAKLEDLINRPGAKLLYEYDLGDGWQHELLLEEILNAEGPFQRCCVAGARHCPPEDCGGPYGFQELLNALNDTSHPEHKFICDWLGEAFDPQEFSVEEVNRRLRNQRSPRRKAAAKD